MQGEVLIGLFVVAAVINVFFCFTEMLRKRLNLSIRIEHCT